jgi:hypothetical protein
VVHPTATATATPAPFGLPGEPVVLPRPTSPGSAENRLDRHGDPDRGGRPLRSGGGHAASGPPGIAFGAGPHRNGRRMRGRHVRPPGRLRVTPVPTVPEPSTPQEQLVLLVLRRRPIDLDAVQVAAAAGLPPSIAASALHRLVQAGLAQDLLVGGRLRFRLP